MRAVFTDEQLQIEQVLLAMAGHGPKLSRAAVEKGWSTPEFESRLRKRSLSKRPQLQPAWNGFPPKGLRILLIAEQGPGG